jgi:CheY-like chemotaxis protein
MPHGGDIRIRTANAHLELDEQDAEVAPGDYVMLSVTDSGTGMPPEVLARAVEPFFTTKGPGTGSGLGLSMIFGFAKQSGGHLAIDSQPGGGTTVHLYLPRVREAAAADPQHLIDPAMPVGRESVLLVDDNAEMRSVARRHLSALGYRVREAANGPAAVDCLREGKRFDLLFTDVIMPDGMTGYQLAAVARQMQPGLKVLFTTGYARPVETLEQSDRPLGRVLRKPYRKLDLAMAVREVLEA